MDKLMDPLHLKPLPPSAAIHNLFSSYAFRGLFVLSMLVAITATLLTYWSLDRQHPYDFDGSRSSVVPDPARGNDQMVVRWKVGVNRTCPGLIRREIIDPKSGVVIAAYDPQFAAPKFHIEGGYLNKTFTLPKIIPPGWVAYRSRLEYWCNPLQRWFPIRYDTPLLYFEVAG